MVSGFMQDLWLRLGAPRSYSRREHSCLLLTHPGPTLKIPFSLQYGEYYRENLPRPRRREKGDVSAGPAPAPPTSSAPAV